MYHAAAPYYDTFYSNKDYDSEAEFLDSILGEYGANSILDVACGTGQHMKRLEERGYQCVGLDKSKEMLEIAQKRVKGELVEGNLCSFDLAQQFDAVICMFAAFNEIISDKEIAAAFGAFRSHLKVGGILILDLYHYRGDGEKEERFGNVKRSMAWKMDHQTGLLHNTVLFKTPKGELTDHFSYRSYDPQIIAQRMEYEGFNLFSLYADYERVSPNPSSANLIAVGQLKSV